MEVPCQCLSSLLIKHPAVVLSIPSSVPLHFTEQRMDVEKYDEAQEEQVDRDEKYALSLSKDTVFINRY